jgi:hypothetical protein
MRDIEQLWQRGLYLAQSKSYKEDWITDGGPAVSLQHYMASNRHRYSFIVTDSTAQEEVARLLQSNVVADLL